MIRHPLGLRLDPDRPVRDQLYEAARLGARGVVVDATGDLAPHRLSETGRRELRHVLRTVELSLVALSLPTRRPFDTTDQLDDRIRRADAAFAMAYELGTKLVLARAGASTAGGETRHGARRSRTPCASWAGGPSTAGSGWRSRPAPSRRETLKSFLEAMGSPGLAASIDPASGSGRPASTRSRPCASSRRGSCMPMPTTRPARPASRGPNPRGIRVPARCPRLGRILWVRSRRLAIAAS